MKKTEWLEEYEKDLEKYDKSILSHEDNKNDPMKTYEFSILHHNDESYCESNDWYEPIKHFSD